MLGKRKRDTIILRRSRGVPEDTSTSNPIDSSSNDVFRKFFEATFNPLPISSLGTSSPEEDDEDGRISQQEEDSEGSLTDEDTASDWSGFSDNPTKLNIVKVVDHAATTRAADGDPISRGLQKSFMSFKPPRDVQSPAQTSNALNSKAEDEREEKVNLKNDLDLQRLLRESHLLEQTKKKPDDGAQRHKATDLRLQNLGSKTSLFTQDKMPMSHRKGIAAKALSQEARRRKEAKENGVILEKSSRKSLSSSSRRDRGVDVPVVGRFKGGTLQLSRKDVASIQGPRRGVSKKGRR